MKINKTLTLTSATVAFLLTLALSQQTVRADDHQHEGMATDTTPSEMSTDAQPAKAGHGAAATGTTKKMTAKERRAACKEQGLKGAELTKCVNKKN